MRTFLLFLNLATSPLFSVEPIKPIDLQASTKTTIEQPENNFLTSTDSGNKIAHRVNPLTGEYVDQEVDLVVAGTAPLSLRRFYNHFAPYDPRYAGWRYNPESSIIANFELSRAPCFVAAGEADGSVLYLDNRGESSYSFNLTQQKGFCHFTPSGQNHPLNAKVTYRKIYDRDNRNRFEWHGDFADGSGSQRTFSSSMHEWFKNAKVTTKKGNALAGGTSSITYLPTVWTPYHIPVSEERRPDGTFLVYEYKKWKNDEDYPKPFLLTKITAKSSDKKIDLGYLEFDYNVRDAASIRVRGSDGRQANVFHRGESPIVLNSASCSGKPYLKYTTSSQYITLTERGDGRFLQTDYYPNGKVSTQSAPVGPKGKMCPIGRYTYHERSTEVFDAEGHKTVYHFDDNKRLLCIETYQGEKLYRVERPEWDPSTGNLKAKTTEDGYGKKCLTISYEYDKNHNPIVETVGNETGSHSIYRTYSDDGFNLKLTESDREGKKTFYSYVPKTNLLASELIYEGNLIRKRIFHAYDTCATCVKTIVDDGSSTDEKDLSNVTYRKIIEITPKKTIPCLGLPEVVLEKTLNSKKEEILLRKIVYAYTPFGKVEKEDHYDCEGTLKYSLVNTYTNELLASKKDALGHTTTFTHDANHNLTSISGPSPKQHQIIDYDKADRATFFKTHQSDGSLLISEKRYDKLGQVTHEIDTNGHVTCFEYDDLGRIKFITHPDGSKEGKEYDVLGNVIKETDAEGYSTVKKYNFRGSPLSILHPDGVDEQFTYFSHGPLKTHVDRNGTKHVFDYDLFDNVIKKESFDSKGNLLKVIKASYSPFQKLTETDGMGVTTIYAYDFAGRKTSEEVGGKKRTFFYDTLGRLTKTDEGDFYAIDIFDVAGNLKEKRIEDKKGRIQFSELYEYDEAGNRTKVTNCSGVTITTFNTLGKPTEIKDALGNITHHDYTFGIHHSHTETNAKGLKTKTTYDERKRVKEVLKKNAKDEVLFKTENKYDKNNLLKETTHSVLDGPRLLKTITHVWTYGPCGRLEKFEEAGEKTTSYFYDAKGKLQKVIKPSKKEIMYEYDGLGLLKRQYSSDFDYTYTYDKNDRISDVYDAIHKTTTTRKYDALGHLKHETLGNRLALDNDFDAYGRRKSVSLPNGSLIKYEYDGAYLLETSYREFKHTYTKRNTLGQITKMDLPSNLGSVEIEWDALSRWKKYTSPFSSLLFPKNAFDQVGNLCEVECIDSLGKRVLKYSYDELDQLSAENDHCYRFDSLMNCLKKDGRDYKVNHLCQLKEDGKKTFTYDDDGNLTSDGIFVFAYDSLDRLIKMTGDNISVEYIYDAFNRRITKEVLKGWDDYTYYYLWDGDNEIGMTNHRRNFEELRILGEGLGAEIGSSVICEINGTVYIPLHDHRGCLTTLIDPDKKQCVETYRYTAFGEELTGNKLSPWRFSSKRVDEETDLVYFGRRYYAPQLGRWLTKDPEGFVDGPNPYAYLHNCPMDDFDLYGLWSWNMNNPKNRAEMRDHAHRFAHNTIEFAYPHTYQMTIDLKDSPWWQKTMLFPAAVFDTGMLLIGERALTLTAEKLVMPGLSYAGKGIQRAFTSTLQAERKFELNRFHQAAQNLPEVAQNNIRVLRGWAKSKGWEKLPNLEGGPEKWGKFTKGKFDWNLRIKPEASLRPGLDSGSAQARFDARLGTQPPYDYINPFTRIRGNRSIGTHIPLE